MAVMEFTEYEGLPWEPVQSSNLSRVAFVPPEEDPHDGTLYVEFHSQKGLRAYQYTGVDPDVFGEMLEAESVGSFFNTMVKGRFETDRIAVR